MRNQGGPRGAKGAQGFQRAHLFGAPEDAVDDLFDRFHWVVQSDGGGGSAGVLPGEPKLQPTNNFKIFTPFIAVE